MRFTIDDDDDDDSKGNRKKRNEEREREDCKKKQLRFSSRVCVVLAEKQLTAEEGELFFWSSSREEERNRGESECTQLLGKKKERESQKNSRTLNASDLRAKENKTIAWENKLKRRISIRVRHICTRVYVRHKIY